MKSSSPFHNACKSQHQLGEIYTTNEIKWKIMSFFAITNVNFLLRSGVELLFPVSLSEYVANKYNSSGPATRVRIRVRFRVRFHERFACKPDMDPILYLTPITTVFLQIIENTKKIKLRDTYGSKSSPDSSAKSQVLGRLYVYDSPYDFVHELHTS
jgi:hypothetical protein